MTEEVKIADVDLDVPREEDLAWARHILGFRPGESSVKDRLQAVQHWLGGQNQLENSTEVSRSTFKTWINRSHIPAGSSFEAIVTATGLSREFLAHGRITNLVDFAVEEVRLNRAKGDFPIPSSGPGRRNARRQVIAEARDALAELRASLLAGSGFHEGGITVSGSAPNMPEGYVALSPLEPDVADGRLQVQRFSPSPMAVSVAWLNSLGLEPAHCSYRLATEDSVFSVGALMYVDRRAQGLQSGRVYLVRFGAELLPRRVARRLDGSFEFFADRGSFPREVVDAEQIERMSIAGRVFWVGASV